MFSELYFATPIDWHQVRGAQMILSMKIISLGFDMDSYQPKGKNLTFETSPIIQTSAFLRWSHKGKENSSEGTDQT